jgi:hypothetical protein
MIASVPKDIILSDFIQLQIYIQEQIYDNVLEIRTMIGEKDTKTLPVAG